MSGVWLSSENPPPGWSTRRGYFNQNTCSQTIAGAYDHLVRGVAAWHLPSSRKAVGPTAQRHARAHPELTEDEIATEPYQPPRRGRAAPYPRRRGSRDRAGARRGCVSAELVSGVCLAPGTRGPNTSSPPARLLQPEHLFPVVVTSTFADDMISVIIMS